MPRAVAAGYDAQMPTVLRSGPYRLFLYAGDGSEPPHVHVERDECEAKFWLDPVRLERSRGFPRHELRAIENLVGQYEIQLLERWHEFFGR